MTDKKQTRAQIEAGKRRLALQRAVLKALGKKPINMRQLAAKLGLASADGSVKASVAAKIRKAIAALIEDGKAETDGALRTMTYRKA